MRGSLGASGLHPIDDPATLDHTLIMLTPLSGRCIGLSALVCVLLLFFFPLTQGNFQSTHGPVTALRAKRNLLVLVFSIISAALLVFAMLIFRQLFERVRSLSSANESSGLLHQAALSSILRC